MRGTVRVEVRDADPVHPEPQSVSPLSLRGRGLQIVETASDRWGVRSHPGGKVVWFEAAVGLADGSAS